MESNNSAQCLIIISKLYQENKINDEDRDKLKGRSLFIFPSNKPL